jgi:serpin B
MTRRAALGLLGAGLLPPHRSRPGPFAAGRAQAADASDGDKAAVVKGNTEFGLDLYGRLRAADGNLFCSPYSISTALAMTYAGARGATAAEMAGALRFSLPPDRLHPAFGTLFREINAPGAKRASELFTANALWSQKGVPFEPSFQQLVRSAYGAGLQEVDFARATETARRTINAWVEQQTRDRIKDLLREGMLDPMTVLVLTNAIYFKGTWRNAFPKEATQPGDFSLDARRAVQGVPLMHQRDVYPYLDGETLQVIDLPYQANELSMIIALPRKVDGLEAIERTLTAVRVNEWTGKMTPHEVAVVIPRFKITRQFALGQPLMDLGMKRAFSPYDAYFSAMVKARRVFVSAVIHQGFVDVNEKGTEAAAATAGLFMTASARPPTPVFRADHPFFFLIRENRTGSVLFAGRVTNPLAG